MIIDCQYATRLLSESQDRSLTAAERLQLHIHLPICTGCRRFRVQLGMMRQMMQRFSQASVPNTDAE